MLDPNPDLESTLPRRDVRYGIAVPANISASLCQELIYLVQPGHPLSEDGSLSV
jgi:hypothetical protein